MYNRLRNEPYLDLEESDRNWLKLLCSVGSSDEFDIINQGCKSTTLAIMKYRKVLRSRQTGESFLKINTAYVNKNQKELHKLLEYMFLEFIPVKQFGFILERINNKENGLLELYNRHTEDPDARILSLIITL